MQPDEADDPIGGFARGSEPPKDVLGHLGADHLMLVKVAVRSRGRLADVMKQRRQPHASPLHRHGIDGAQRVVPEILAGDLVLRNSSLGG